MVLPTIPFELKKVLIPDEHLSITEFLQFSMPADSPPLFINVDSYLSADVPNCIEPTLTTLLRTVAIPPKKVLDAFKALSVEKIETSNIKSICIPYLSTSLRFPLWIMTYWVTLSKVRKSHMRWETANEALQQTISYNHFPYLSWLHSKMYSSLCPKYRGIHISRGFLGIHQLKL